MNAPPDLDELSALTRRIVADEYAPRGVHDGGGDYGGRGPGPGPGPGIHGDRGVHSHSDCGAGAGRAPAPARIARAAKPDGSWVTAIDRRTQARLRDELARRWPEYGFIGEEMPHAEQHAVCARHRGGAYWVLDPLDGTTNFAAGFPFYGVSLALVADGRAQLGVVFDPVRDECFTAEPGGGARLNGARLECPAQHAAGAPAALAECIAIVDYKRLVADLAEQLVRSPPYRSQRNLGASALEWCWLAAGRAHLYLHGGQKVWDFAAGHLILSEAGGRATSLSGKPLDCVRLRKRSVVAAANPALLTMWHDWLRAHSATPGYSPL
ncbi:MAG: inositol monophosphatase [Gammaproteobacteria bacterium]|nr:inositol monophosphatase [Gammaproteobacteria bacterium]